jgi:hypothetical protein
MLLLCVCANRAAAAIGLYLTMAYTVGRRAEDPAACRAGSVLIRKGAMLE